MAGTGDHQHARKRNSPISEGTADPQLATAVSSNAQDGRKVTFVKLRWPRG